MSVLGKKWLIKNKDSNKSIFEKMLENRGFSKSIDEDLEFHDPYLFKDMEKAVSRIKEAIEKQERIIVFGDYDVDGITAAAILIQTLKKLGANSSYRLPNRMHDGYGLSEKFIDEFIEKDIKLVITVDCGIACKNEIKKAKDNGIDVIITDHHSIPDNFPDDACAIIHPKIQDTNYPYSELTGAGVALKLAKALMPDDYEELLDLAAMGTIADLGPLTGENRLIVKKGLKVLSNTKWPGLSKIKEYTKLKKGEKVDTFNVGYQIAPRINAAGRIGNPYTALALILQETEDEKTLSLSQKLEDLNKERQEMTLSSVNDAEGNLDKSNLPSIIIDHRPGWHVGILGLIAGRLCETYSRPSIMMQDFGETLVASARGPQFFNIVEALKECSDLLISFGGHAQAAGFTIKKENLEKFIKKITAYADKKLKNESFESVLEIDCEIDNKDLSFNLIDQIGSMEPFGIANQKPIFVLKNVEPLFVSNVGKGAAHLKFSIQNAGKNIGVIAFRMGDHVETLRKHRKIDLAFHLERNVWNNKESIQLQALDFEINEG